jgi:predicted enzyme related to lactoylglutathione lyase
MGQPVTAWQIVTRQPEKLQTFYSTLFGWEIDANNALGYRVVDTGSERGIDGGMWPAPPDAHDFVQLFIDVDDVAAVAKRVVELGGKVIVPPQKLPDGDEMAILQDPAGISFGLKCAMRE